MGENWKRTNEIWFGGDTFNRNGTIAFATEDGGTVTAQCKGVDFGKSGEATLSCSNVVFNDAAISKLCTNEYVISSQVDTLQSQLQQLQAQIEELKSHQVTTSSLRSTLKTLQYKREVE